MHLDQGSARNGGVITLKAKYGYKTIVMEYPLTSMGSRSPVPDPTTSNTGGSTANGTGEHYLYNRLSVLQWFNALLVCVDKANGR